MNSESKTTAISERASPWEAAGHWLMRRAEAMTKIERDECLGRSADPRELERRMRELDPAFA
jgi:hypothetical protein